MKHPVVTITSILLLPIILISCASSAKHSTFSSNNNNDKIECLIVKHDTPTVVFENGLGGTLDWWKKIFPIISKDYSAFAYNRPGYGKSGPATTSRDGNNIVEELRSLLKHNGLFPPYILVGHSTGGLYMQLFARKYPEEVKSLILVDATHPNQLKGNGSPDIWPLWFKIIFNLSINDAAKNEFKKLEITGESVLSLPSVTDKPVIVLSALKPMNEKSLMADDANEKRKDIARLYPNSKQIWVDCGHAIPLEKPDIVIDVIRNIFNMTN